MTLKKHQELMQLMEIIAMRAGTCSNAVDHNLYIRVIEYLDELQQLTSKDLK